MMNRWVLPRLAISATVTARATKSRACLRRPRNAITRAPSISCSAHQSCFHTLTSTTTFSSSWDCPSLSSTFQKISFERKSIYDPQLQAHRHSLQQVRWKRKSGNVGDQPSFRKPSKKQKKRTRKQLERNRDLLKHSAPGSKAGPRREYAEELRQSMIDDYQARLDGSHDEQKLLGNPLRDPALEYTEDDALLDDLVGNSGHWTSQITPEPAWYGNQQRFLYNRVADQMELYSEELQALPPGRPTPNYLLPSDVDIAKALKAYRDQQGSRNRPIGIAKALQHVLQDMRIPSSSVFGEYTFNALLSCCRTPKEGVRVFEIMQKQQHEISAYSWAILVDINAKVGDYEGAVRALDEMQAAGHEPNMAAYTSVLAACYKVCNNGRIAHSIRAKAGKVGWEKWQELRIRGLEPDAMCYGAMLRLCAARGLPEKAYNLLQEMPRFDVPPTTLCFTSALKAIAKSHETAVRYERGWSKKNKRRERIAAHHGKLARNVVMIAEESKVKIDDGFVSALQLCAAAAGDSATAKAIYLAHKVRVNMKHWRQIGDDAHLARLRGEDPDAEQQQMIAGSYSNLQLYEGNGDSRDVSSAIAHRYPKRKRKQLTYEEREYGVNDTRTLSAILRACAQASDSNGVGTMWSGRENYGYLDLTSLRLIQQYSQPKMRNTDIPGMSRTQVGMGALVNLEDMENPRKRNDPFLRRGARKNFPGMVTLDDAGKGLDDLPGDMENMFFDKDGMLKQEYIDSGLYPEYERIQENNRYLEEKAQMEEARRLEAGDGPVQQIECGKGDLTGSTSMYFCMEDRRWKTGQQDKIVTRSKTQSSSQADAARKSDECEAPIDDVEWYFDNNSRKWSTRVKTAPAMLVDHKHLKSSDQDKEQVQSVEEDWYFDDETRSWKARLNCGQETDAEPKLTEFEVKAIENARQMKNETREIMANADGNALDLDEGAVRLVIKPDGTFVNLQEEESFQVFFRNLQNEVEEDEEDLTVDENEARELYVMMREEFSDANLAEQDTPTEGAFEFEDLPEIVDDDDSLPTHARGRHKASKDFGVIMNELKDEWGDDGLDLDVGDWSDDSRSQLYEAANTSMIEESSRSEEGQKMKPEMQSMHAPTSIMEALEETEGDPSGNALATQTMDFRLQNQSEDGVSDTPEMDDELVELMQLLPGMPISRLKRVRQAYLDNLSDPSFLTLVPLLRERMPDWFTANSIRKANLRSANFVMEKANEAGIVDRHLLNGMLQVHCSSGSLNNAMKVYDLFEEYEVKPTEYTNRLVVQMFLKQRRLSRCLDFKKRVEAQGQKLDLLSYGSLIQHCSRHNQLGSAFMFLKECIAVNGSPPGENYLKQLRILCRGMEDEIGLESMIGEDPIAWLRHGEAVLKREYSKRGNRDLNLVKNAMVRG